MTCPCKTIPLVRAFALLSLVFSMSGCGISPEVYRREVEARRAAENRAATAENRAYAAESRARIAEDRAAKAERQLSLTSPKLWLPLAIAGIAVAIIEGFVVMYLRGRAAEEFATRPILMQLLLREERRACLTGPDAQLPPLLPQETDESR